MLHLLKPSALQEAFLVFILVRLRFSSPSDSLHTSPRNLRGLPYTGVTYTSSPTPVRVHVSPPSLNVFLVRLHFQSLIFRQWLLTIPVHVLHSLSLCHRLLLLVITVLYLSCNIMHSVAPWNSFAIPVPITVIMLCGAAPLWERALVTMFPMHLLSGPSGTLAGTMASVPDWLATTPPPTAEPQPSQPAVSIPTAQVEPSRPSATPSSAATSLPGPSTSAGSSAESQDFIMPSSGLPPIPGKIVQAIKDGKFVEFGDLLPEALREAAFEAVCLQEDKKKRKKKFYINSPADWSLAFSLYSAVAVHFHPDKAFNLAVYATIVMGLARDTRSSQVWLQYDRLFRQAVAINPSLQWHRREPDLWLMATAEFTTSTSQGPSRYSSQPNKQPAGPPLSSSSEEACRRYNKGSCPFTDSHCRYQHVCQRCMAPGHVFKDCPKVPSRRPPPRDSVGDS